MDFDLSEEQSPAQGQRGPPDRGPTTAISKRRNGYAKEPGGWSRAVWKDSMSISA